MARHKTICCCLDQEYMHVFLLNGIVQVSEWNFDLTSVNLRVA